MEQGGSHADPAEAARHVARLRTASFTLIVGGGLIAGLGSTLPWATTTISNSLSWDTRGTDTVSGMVTLAAAVVAIVGGLLMRAGREHKSRRSMIALALAGGVVATVAAGLAAGMSGKIADDSLREEAAQIASRGKLSPDTVLEQLRAIQQDTIRPGVWVTLAGGLLIVAGGPTSIVWARARTRAQDEPELPEPPAAG